MVTIRNVRKIYGAVPLAGQNVVTLFRERVALSSENRVAIAPDLERIHISTAKAASGLSLLRTERRRDGTARHQLIANHFPTRGFQSATHPSDQRYCAASARAFGRTGEDRNSHCEQRA
ncbi:hypothetical protein JKG68_16385 [Microvirga aerilata]|uniref:Uncharacterized protein n=1 Tax=Microvirga aerilata TaxID=670292 RepID=A0A936ZGP4_9HYPH|nr:hypothetical protein [Microvirga aerilata]MBL0405545.1 hypothetical protein [Microvirga aerilata]